MSKTILREQALKLRTDGYTYTQIRKKINVSKSTLSKWLADFPWDADQHELIKSQQKLAKELGREKFRATMFNKKLNRLKDLFNHQANFLVPLSNKELLIAGLFLYWGEGEKTHGRLSLSNTNPKIVKFTLYWMVHILDIPKDGIKVQLHLYQDMEFQQEINFWSKTLRLNKHQFYKPYIKKTTREGLTYKNFGHGTCKLYYGSVFLSEKVAMSIKAISEYYGDKSNTFWYN